MICTVEQKFDAAGNGAKFADDQPVAVDGVLVQHIVFLKLPRVVDEVIVDGKLPHLNIGVGDGIFQIDRRIVPRAGVHVRRLHHGRLLSQRGKREAFHLVKSVVLHKIYGLLPS